ncbi:MAG: sigma-54-dependent Fis family transcriptional regulator [bacterium]|nr:sigma-54-dependent Fis family transcriptional regulator [bacterium]
MIRVLLLEDVDYMRNLVRSQLETAGYLVDEAVDVKEAVAKVKEGNHHIYVLDLVLPDGSSIELLDRFPNKTAGNTIIITGNPSTPSVVEAIKKGAYNYLEKPVDARLLICQIEKIIDLNNIRLRSRSVCRQMASDFTLDNIVTRSKAMEKVIARARILAGTENTVLITGETGVGKEVLSHSIHNASARAKRVFLPINCAAVPHELFESELFGYEKGAFTGADSEYGGRFQQADRGTLFLDEIGELPMPIQAKLLRILDERLLYKLRSRTPVPIDVRLIAATNLDLAREIKARQFRGDLYYRLQESTIEIPPLRERQEDILPLFHHFVSNYNHVYQKEVTRLSRQAEDLLLGHRWDGNVRELKNTVKSIIPFKDGNTVEAEDLPATVKGAALEERNRWETLDEFEGRYILKILKVTGFNIKRSSELLGITRARLYRKIDQFDLRSEVEDEE